MVTKRKAPPKNLKHTIEHAGKKSGNDDDASDADGSEDSGGEAKSSSKGFDRESRMMSLLGELEKKIGINAISLGTEDRMDSGLCCLNILLGGGYAPGFYINYGPEQSAKTTMAITTLGSSVESKVDLRVLWDAENSSGSSTDYISNIFNTMGVRTTVEQLFGVRKAGKYIEKPLVYYRDDYEGNKFFNWLHALQKRLPDKRFEEGRWWYIYDETPENKKMLGSSIHRGMTAKNPGLWAEAEDGRLQAIIILDSFPSLVPSSMDEDEGDNSLAVQARMFSKHLPRIKGAFRAKRICLIGVNQLRINPMARFGNPETEPGGQALKFFSDVRFRFFPRALSALPFVTKGEQNVEKEQSVEFDGYDTYRYVEVTAVKNKLSIPGRKTWLRVWVSDAEGNARGYDPVWDQFYYLYSTGQASGKRSSILLNISGLGEAKKNLTWLEFKLLVLGTKEDKIKVCTKIGYKAINLRAGIMKQTRSGRSEDMYIEHTQATAKAKAAKAKAGGGADDDGDDD